MLYAGSHKDQESTEALKYTVLKITDIESVGSTLQDYKKDILARFYLNLFPFVYGHPGTERSISLSFEQC